VLCERGAHVECEVNGCGRVVPMLLPSPAMKESNSF